MNQSLSNNKKLFVLDTNVLMHDPASLFRFKEHDIFIPMIVLEELDNSKKGLSEVSRNVRQVSRFLDDLIQGLDEKEIHKGIFLSQLGHTGQLDSECRGRLFFEVQRTNSLLPDSLPGDIADNSILGTVLALSHEHTETQVVLVSKDINLRIKATVLGIHAEDYHSDQVLDDIDLLYSGTASLPKMFWENHSKSTKSWQDQNQTFYELESSLAADWYPNEFLYIQDSDFEAIVHSSDGTTGTLRLAYDFRKKNHSVWGINARNREQNFALNMLLDPEIDFVTLLGTAGTGKTLLALAAGLEQTLEQKIYREIIMTRETIPVGEDIGFLPGTEEEKMAPWMGALLDNLELLSGDQESRDWEKTATNTLILNRIKIRSLNFMRGRTFLNRYIILDEAQNLTSKQMKTLITRAGPGTKIVCIGNIGQIDTPYLTATTSGLTYVVDRFKSWGYGGHVTLRRGERSRLADFASETL
ncbi:MAG: PhoH family protein [Methylococcales bacterium]